MKKFKLGAVLTLVLTGTMLAGNVQAETLALDVPTSLGEKGVSVTKYYNTITTYDKNHEPIESKSYEITEDMYDSGAEPLSGAMPLSFGESASHETNAKKITLEVVGGGNSQKVVTITVDWKTIPNVKEIDIIGYYGEIDGGLTFSPDEAQAQQIYDGNTLTYTNSSGNKIKKTGGLAYVMNIVDSTSQSLRINMVSSFISSRAIRIYATYQHATSTSITSSEARQVKFGRSASGSNVVLGGAFILPSSIAQKYDRMAGVNVYFDPTFEV